jgi:hypothetical protein
VKAAPARCFHPPITFFRPALNILPLFYHIISKTTQDVALVSSTGGAVVMFCIQHFAFRQQPYSMRTAAVLLPKHSAIHN